MSSHRSLITDLDISIIINFSFLQGAFICRYLYGFSMFADTITKLYGPTKPTPSDLHDAWAIFRFNHGNALTNKFCYYAVDRLKKANRLTTAIHRTKIPSKY